MLENASNFSAKKCRPNGPARRGNAILPDGHINLPLVA